MAETEDRAVALVTGASRGIGRALAESLAATHHVVAVARTQGGLEELDDCIKERGGTATLAPADIADSDAMAGLCRLIHDRWGRLDLWAHAAIHAAPLTPADQIDAKEWDRSVAVNVAATGTLIQYLAPLLGADAQAIFLDDPQAGAKFFGAYGATKAAQIALARSWAAETRRIGPRIRVLAPRPTRTASRARFHPGEDPAGLASPQEEARRLLAAE